MSWLNSFLPVGRNKTFVPNYPVLGPFRKNNYEPMLMKKAASLIQRSTSNSPVIVIPRDALWPCAQDSKKILYDENGLPPPRVPSSPSTTNPSSPSSLSPKLCDQPHGLQLGESLPHPPVTQPIPKDDEPEQPPNTRKLFKPSRFLNRAKHPSRKVFGKTCGKAREQGGLAEDPTRTEQDVRWRDKQDMKRRLISEFSTDGNNRDGSLSLFFQSKNSEGAAIGSPSGGDAPTNVSDESLNRSIREFSPRHTVAEMTSIILDWAGTTPTDLMAKKFEPHKVILLEMFRNVWDPQEKDGLRKRFLTRRKYVRVTKRVIKGRRLSVTQENLLLNTVQGMDIVKLLGELYNHGLVTSSDVLCAGEILSSHFCENGYAFALYTLIKDTSARVCCGEAGGRACLLMDEASNVMRVNEYGFETLDCHVRLCRLVDENINVHSEDGDEQRLDSGSTREKFRRRVHIKYVQSSFLTEMKETIF